MRAIRRIVYAGASLEAEQTEHVRVVEPITQAFLAANTHIGVRATATAASITAAAAAAEGLQSRFPHERAGGKRGDR